MISYLFRNCWGCVSGCYRTPTVHTDRTAWLVVQVLHLPSLHFSCSMLVWENQDPRDIYKIHQNPAYHLEKRKNTLNFSMRTSRSRLRNVNSCDSRFLHGRRRDTGAASWPTKVVSQRKCVVDQWEHRCPWWPTDKNMANQFCTDQRSNSITQTIQSMYAELGLFGLQIV